MKCPRCSQEATEVETRAGTFGTIERRRQCASGHRFITVELVQPPRDTVARRWLGNLLRTTHLTKEPTC